MISVVFMTWKEKWVICQHYKGCKTKEVETEQSQESKEAAAAEEMEDDFQGPLNCHENKHFPSVFSNVEVYINR